MLDSSFHLFGNHYCKMHNGYQWSAWIGPYMSYSLHLNQWCTKKPGILFQRACSRCCKKHTDPRLYVRTVPCTLCSSDRNQSHKKMLGIPSPFFQSLCCKRHSDRWLYAKLDSCKPCSLNLCPCRKRKSSARQEIQWLLTQMAVGLPALVVRGACLSMHAWLAAMGLSKCAQYLLHVPRVNSVSM
jgi:hypothetical protein